MKEVNLMPPAKRKVVAGVASFALACSMMPTAGVAWAAETTEEPTEVTESAPETPSTSGDETPEVPEQPEADPEEAASEDLEADPEPSTPPAEEPTEEEESLIDPQLEEPTEATVAEVNGEAFATVKDALAAASAGSAVTLTADATLEGDQFGISKDITLDLGGHTLDLQNALFTTAGTNVTIKNGTIVANDAPKTALIFKGAATLQSVKVQVAGAQPAVKANAGSTVILEKTSINAQVDALVVDGAAAMVKVKNGSSVVSAQGPALKVEGKNGGNAQIDIAGTVNGGAGFAIVLTGTNATEGSVKLTEFANGKIVTNGTLAVRCQLPTATLAMQGGTITSAGRGVKMEAGTLNATGTAFNCATPIETAGTGTALVTRGQFKGDVTAFCQTGYAARYDSNTQRFDIVAIGNAVAQIMRESDAVLYENINAAIADLQEGDTLNLLADVTVDSNASTNAAAIKLPRLCTLNGNGHTIKAGTFARPSHMINVLAGGVTIKDVTIDMANATNSKHGINVHGSAAWAKIENVTITNANTAAVVVNGSAPQGVTVNGLTTSGSGWGAINVDKGGTLIFNSGSLGEDNKIWTETDSASNITVNAPGIDSVTTYDLGGSGTVMTYYAAADQVEQLAVADTDGAKFGDLQLALTRAEDNATVTLLQDVERGNKTNDVLLVSKSITLDGAGHTVNSKAPRIVRIDESDVTVSLKDIQLIGNAAERGVQVDPSKTGVKLIMDGCDVAAQKYAVQLCSGACADIEISNSTIAGWNAFNVFSEGSRVTVMGSTLNGHNNFAYDAEGYNNFAVIAFNGGAVGNALTLADCTITATSDTDNLQRIILFNANSADNVVSFSGENTVASYLPGSFEFEKGTNNAITISGGTFTDDVSEFCVPGKVWENGVIVDEVTEPETPETPVTPVPDPQQPVTPAPAPQPQQPVTPSTPNAVQSTGAGVRFAPVVAAEEAAEEMGLVAPTEAAAQAFQSTESIQDAETPMAKERAAVVAEDQTGIDWRTITGATIVVLLAAGGLLAALCRRKGQEAS